MSTSIKSFMTLAAGIIPTNVSILIRGAHGIGKSQVVAQVAEELGLPVMERRLSQMSEGDMVGLPFTMELSNAVTDTSGRARAPSKVGTDAVKSWDAFQVTSFCPPDWLAACAERPHLIFLDEMNRATPEVIQAAFQLVLDRRVGALVIHPECRIFVAVNCGPNYQVNEMDPALLDRFAVFDLEPTVEDWINWASSKGGLTSTVVEFIRQNEAHLEVKGGSVTPGTVTPSRRSWERVDRTLQSGGLYSRPNEPIFFQAVACMVGREAASAFQKFACDNQQISAEDVMDRWSTTEPKVKALAKARRTPELTGIIERCRTWWAAHPNAEASQVESFGEFLMACGPELAVSCWTAIAPHGANNLRKMPHRVTLFIAQTVQAGMASAKAA